MQRRARVHGQHGPVPWRICVQWYNVRQFLHQRRQLRLWRFLQWWNMPTQDSEWGDLQRRK